MNGPMKSYNQSVLVGPYRKADIPDIKIDYRGLIAFAHQKGVRVCDLTDDEKNRFIEDADMSIVRKRALKVV